MNYISRKLFFEIVSYADKNPCLHAACLQVGVICQVLSSTKKNIKLESDRGVHG